MEYPDFIQEQINDKAIMINPGKVLDNNNAYKMVETITEIQSRGYKYIVLDMKELEFLSSAGVGSILGTIEVSREMGGDIVICNISDTILHILQVLDLADYLTITNNLQKVIGEFGVKVS